jgi:GNAT superfamily N-acetyltransferase
VAIKPIGLRFTPPHAAGPGVLAATLKLVYAPLVESYPETWGREQAGWEEFDREVFQNPRTVGACTFLTWLDNRLVGFGSYDPRQRPRFGIIGHNCILPEFRGRGFGAAQVRKILRRFRTLGIRVARVTTGGHPFFVPAQRMYLACGFREVRCVPWPRDPQQRIIEYEREIGQPARRPKRGSAMTSKEIDVVKTFITAINSHSPDAISRLMTDDHTFVDSGGTVQTGRESMTEGWAGYFRMFPDYQIQADCIFADKNLVAVFGSAAGTYNGKRGLVPENRIEMPAAWKAIVEKGRIRHWQVYTDWTEGCKIISQDNAAG